LEQVDKLLQGKIDQYNIIKRYYHKDGSIVWGNLSVSLVKDHAGSPAYFIAVVEDVTPRIKAEEQASQRQQELTHAARLATMGEMASGLAHEINQPLSAIVNYSSGCLRRLDNDSLDEGEQRRVIELINEQADRAAEIMKRLRNFVRKAEPEREVVDLSDVIENVRRFIDKEAREQKVEIHISIEKDLPLVYADPIQIEQVLLNLVRNALDAMLGPDILKRELFIKSVKTDSGYVEVTVRDTGVGISPENMAMIFDPFFSTKKDGTGLGLSISQSLIEAHDGKLWVEKAFAGEGMEFFFTLPIYSGAQNE
jgi:C4-dicarboxylate-specific signal transduction histidine kinase